MAKNILIIAGEPSGDIRGAELMKHLKGLMPDTSFWGIGGDNMSAHGVELVEHIKNLSIVGILEIIKHLPKIRKQYKDLTSAILSRRPALAILIDYPGFNLKVASFLKRSGIPVVYYIIPQVWAWGAWRTKSIKKNVDKAIPLFRFEDELLKASGIEAECAGHPLADKIPSALPQPKDRVKTIALLPGSRITEIKSLLPEMLGAAVLINKERADINFILALSSNIDRCVYDDIISVYPSVRLSLVLDSTFECLAGCDFAIVTSGTATLETAIMERPMIITYRTSFLNACLGRLFMRAPFLGLVNIIAGREVVPELLQQDATSFKLAEHALSIIESPEKMNDIRKELQGVKASLGERGAAKRAAESVRRFVQEKQA